MKEFSVEWLLQKDIEELKNDEPIFDIEYLESEIRYMENLIKGEM